MTKNRRLTIRLDHDLMLALGAHARAFGHSPSDHLRYLIDHDLEVGTPVLDSLLHDIVWTAVGTHHLVTLTGDRDDLPALAAEARHIAKGLGVERV